MEATTKASVEAAETGMMLFGYRAEHFRRAACECQEGASGARRVWTAWQVRRTWRTAKVRVDLLNGGAHSSARRSSSAATSRIPYPCATAAHSMGCTCAPIRLTLGDAPTRYAATATGPEGALSKHVFRSRVRDRPAVEASRPRVSGRVALASLLAMLVEGVARTTPLLPGWLPKLHWPRAPREEP